jgi:virginiamycin B lyase
MKSLRLSTSALFCVVLAAGCSSSMGGLQTSPQSAMPKSISPALVPAVPMAKTAILPASAMLASGLTRDTAIQGPSYTQIPGTASFAAAAPDGSLWVLSNAPAGNDKYIWHYVSGSWTNISGLASRLAVAPNGTLYAINSEGGVYSYSGGTWTTYGGGASDITVDFDGSFYVLSNGNAAGSDQAIWHYNSGWTQSPGSGIRIAGSWDAGNYSALNGELAIGIYILNSAGGIYYYATTNNSFSNTFVQLPGNASAITATTDGGVFVLGYPANASGNAIYYYDLDAGAWTAQAGAGVNISTDGTKLYVIGSSGGIYSSPIRAAQTWAFGGSTASLSAIQGQTPAAVNLSAYNNVSASIQFSQDSSGSSTLSFSDALDNGDITPNTLPVDNATAGYTPVIYLSIYNPGPTTVSFGSNTPGVSLTKTTGFGGATTCHLDGYFSNGGAPTWQFINGTGAISGTSVTVNPATLGGGNTVDFTPGQTVVAVACH